LRHRSVGLLALLLSIVPVHAADPIRIPRHPDYSAGRIVFSYLGDLWVVAEDGSNPQRVTVHTARDTNPRFSPDGKWIAFSSDRYGSTDVFVTPAGGGEARQLTFHSAGDTVVGWSRDSARVLFSSARGVMFPGIPNLYEVALEGGIEEVLPTDWGAWGNWSPDGGTLVFNRHPMPWWRKHYRGSYGGDLWAMDAKARTFRRLLDNEVSEAERASNMWPMHAGGEIFFVSDRDTVAKPGSPEVMRSVSNIWKIPAAGGAPVQVTRHSSGSLFHPSISADRKVIVYEEGFGLWKLDTASGKSSEVRIYISSDGKDNAMDLLNLRDEADSFDLSPTTKRAVVSVRGEVFTIATDKGTAARVTRGPSRESSPSWSPDGARIAYVSDASGRDEVWVSDARGEGAKKLTDADTEKFGLSWSPDSASLALTSSDRKLWVLDAATGAAREVASAETAPIQLEFSPDGKWISYSKSDRDLRPHVFIVAASGGEERPLDDDVLFSSSGAHWTKDGKKLIFLGGLVQGGSAAIRDNAAALYSVSLATESKDPMSRDIDDEEAAREAAAEDKPGRGGKGDDKGGDRKGDGDDDNKDKLPEMKIDWDGLSRRIRQVTRISDHIVTAEPAPDSKSYAFVAISQEEDRTVSTLYTIQENGDKQQRLTQSEPPPADADGPQGFGAGISSLQYAKDGKTIYFREGRGIWSVGTGGGEGQSGGRKRVPFSVRVEVDYDLERRQIFNESWRIMKYRFYDQKMHGADWEQMHGRYEALLDDVSDPDELHNVVNQLLGELNASHTGISGGGEPDRDAIRTRFPGFELTPDASGYYKVTHIYERGPADRDYVRVKSGDYLLAIDGIPVKSGDNYWRLYGMAAGRKMELTFNSKPSAEGAWTTRLEPAGAGAHTTLLYEKWVEERRAMVEKLSNGEIGYLHIRQMNRPALLKFERDLSDNHFKKALIIDQRFNPGGGIDQELLAILQQRQYQYTRGRNSTYLTRPQRGFFGPMVVMQNERSTSDAEVFPDGFRTLGLGKTVGVTTYGAVIGTGSYLLVDGSQIRTPGGGLWNVGGTNLENNGVPADVPVDNTPEDFLAGRDAQIEKAVQVLQEELRRLGPQEVPGRQASPAVDMLWVFSDKPKHAMYYRRALEDPAY